MASMHGRALMMRGILWMPNVLLLFTQTMGCTVTLPASPAPLSNTYNCADVRHGKVVWETSRLLAMGREQAQKSSVDESIMELARQVAGIEVRSFSQSIVQMSNDVIDDKLKLTHFAKTKGRILDYEVLNLSSDVDGEVIIYKIELKGSVCADDLVDIPTVLALRELRNLSSNAADVLYASLSKQISRHPKFALASTHVADGYHDIAIDAAIDDQKSWTVDRINAITAIQNSLGYGYAENSIRYATRVSFRLTLRAYFQDEREMIAVVQTIERELVGADTSSPDVVSEMEAELIDLAVKSLVHRLSEYSRKHSS